MGARDFKHYIIMTNKPKDPQLEVTGYIRRFLEDRGAVCSVYTDGGTQGHPTESEQKEWREAACMLVLGGDGTMLRAARDTAQSGIPLLGVNLGTLGYLAEVERAGLQDALLKLLAGEYSIEERMMLRGAVLRRDEAAAPLGQSSGRPAARRAQICAEQALNDVTITRNGPLRVLHFKICVNGQMLGSYGADGLIIATPTGSTGYNMSAGGPIVEPSARMLLLTPVCPHSFNARSVILRAEDEIVVSVEEKQPGDWPGAVVNFDGRMGAGLGEGDVVRITKSEATTSILKLGQLSFLDMLHRKMSE